MDFYNSLRWRLDLSSQSIGLEHLRRGEGHPVFLFHLQPTSQNQLSSIESYNGDSYYARIHCHPHSIHFYWRIIGFNKNDEINYLYI